jgi:hypothetical protein
VLAAVHEPATTNRASLSGTAVFPSQLCAVTQALGRTHMAAF